MSTLNSFLEEREKQLLADLAPINEQAAVIEAELRDVRRALFALNPTPRNAPRRRNGEMTIQEMIAVILEDFPHGATAKRIVQDVEVVFGRKVSRESLAPQLSRMEQAGLLAHDHKLWVLIAPRQPVIAGEALKEDK